jgi:acetate---CoA ligase (ADP-forming)
MLIRSPRITCSEIAVPNAANQSVFPSSGESSNPLYRLVNPRSVVIVGASDRVGSLGERTVSNLLDYSDFRGDVYFINPNRPAIRDIQCYASVLDLPVAPDVAALVVPAKAVLSTLRDCAEHGVRYSLVFSSGFAELGEEGKAAQAEMLRIARNSGMRIYGPNSPGFCNLNRRFGLMFSPSYRVDQCSGPIGLATQGGGIGRCFLQAMERGIGVGLWASTGNEVDLTVAEFIRYMADADDIRVIATAMEGIRDGEQLVDAAKYAAERNKPVIALKIGRSDYGMQATASHTGSISGSAVVNSAVFRQLGIVEVDDIDELIDTAAMFTRSGRLPSGKEKIAVFGFSGGACALTADGVGEGGLTLAAFSSKTLDVLRNALPDYAAIGNPVDATSDIITDPEVGRATLNAVADDPEVDLILYPFPCDYMEITGTIAEMVVKAQQQTSVPIVPIWLSDRLGAGFEHLVGGGLMPTRSVKQTVKAVRRWTDWGAWRARFDPGWIGLPSNAATQGRKVVYTEAAAKALLSQHGLPVPIGAVARTVDDAVEIARNVGYPVVAKIVSAEIQHKSDVGGVATGLDDEAALRVAFERVRESAGTAMPNARIEGVLIEKMAGGGGFEALVGVVRDPVFGPMITFGLGGVYVELFKDVARRKLPLTARSAQELIQEPRCAKLLEGLRGRPPADVAALESLLLAISDFVVRHAHVIEEMELNPVWVGVRGQGAVALDAVLVMREDAGQS